VLGVAALAMMTGASAHPADPGLGRVWPGLAAQEVGRCGFPSVALSYDQALDQYVVVVPGISQAPDAQLRCAAQVSLNTDYYVDFRVPLNRRYEQVYWPMAEGEGRADARDWLASRGLLSKLPAYVKGKTDDLAYARQLEGLCGPRAKGAFAIEQGALTLRTGPQSHPRIDTRTADCLMNAQWASGLPTAVAASQ
jgi:hypothetical protein